jgi:hypothetical protein
MLELLHAVLPAPRGGDLQLYSAAAGEGALRRHVPVRVWYGADYPTERNQVRSPGRHWH